MRVAIVLALLLPLAAQHVAGSFWDGLPIISQIKSAVQAIGGDTEGARKTQENFLDQAPIFSQAKSAVQAISGDDEGARKTQEKFLHETIETAVDNTPGIGHVKGLIHLAVGDTKRGEQILKDATSSTAALAGGIMGGPLGAIELSAATDGVITCIDSAIHQEFRPQGYIDYLANIDHLSIGEHFDKILDVGSEFVGEGGEGKAAVETYASLPPYIVKGSSRNASYDQYLDMADLDFVLDRLNHPSHKDAHDRLVNLDPHVIEGARRYLEVNYKLPREHALRLMSRDFKMVNIEKNSPNCPLCSLSAVIDAPTESFGDLYGQSIADKQDPEAYKETAPKIDHILAAYKKANLNVMGVSEAMRPRYLALYLYSLLRIHEEARFTLIYWRKNPAGFHSKDVRAWKAANGRLRLLTTDYSEAPISKKRFQAHLPPDAVWVYVMAVANVREVDDHVKENAKQYEADFKALAIKAGADGYKCGPGNRVIGYLPNWTRRPFTVKQSMSLTNVIYAYIAMDSKGNLTISDDTISKEKLIELVMARQAHRDHGLKLEISFAVGGWANSEHFSPVLADPEKRKFFIAQIERILNTYQLDGVDIDWQYPVAGGRHEGRPEDRANYVTFLRELREKLGPNKLISIAAGVSPEAVAGYDVPNMIKYVDWIGVMSYDFLGAQDSKMGAQVGPNAPLRHGAPSDLFLGRQNVDWAIKQFVCNSDNNPSKIVMGIPFYGRYWFKTRPPSNPNYPLYREAERLFNGSYGGQASRWQIVDDWRIESRSDFQLHWDERTLTSWATDGSMLLSYETPRSTDEKVKYALEHSLSGVMIWSVDSDDRQDTLLRQVFEGTCHKFSASNEVKHKCSPLGTAKRWWTAEDKDKAWMCGPEAPLYNGFYARCDPSDPDHACCSPYGYCGGSKDYCDCPGCINYAANPDLLLAEPVKPTGPVRWHTGFDIAKRGDKRCGPNAPKLPDGSTPICNPDSRNPCCASFGQCGSDDIYCKCNQCVDYRKSRSSYDEL